MGKYAEALGVWEHKLGAVTHNLRPVKGDNLAFARIQDEGKKRGDDAWILEQVSKWYYSLVIRDYPTLDEKERKELELWIEMNIAQIFQDCLVAFRWVTEKQLDSIKKRLSGDEEKK